MFKQMAESRTLMTWYSFAAKTLNAGVVLLMVLANMPDRAVAVWQLFLVTLSIQFLLDLGFSQTFARVIAYAMGGSSQLEDFEYAGPTGAGEPNWAKVGQIVTTMSRTFMLLAVALVVMSVALLTPALWTPIEKLANPGDAWRAWAVLVASSAWTFYGLQYSAFLQGVDEVAKWRRGEALAAMVSATACAGVVFLGHGLLALVVARQVVYVGHTFYNRWLCTRVHDGRWRRLRRWPFDRDTFMHVWSRSWRTGVGMLASIGLIQGSGLVYAQMATAAEAASYLLAIKVLDTVILFSQAPLYSQLPRMARMRTEGRITKQIKLARRGMTLGYSVYVAGMLAAGVLIPPLLDLLESDTHFVDAELWALMTLAFFIVRHDAMLLQMYTLTNRIVWHIVNGVTCLIAAPLGILLYTRMGIDAVPMALLIAHTAFFTWFIAGRVSRAFRLPLVEFEIKTSAVPAGVMLVGVVLLMYL